MIESNNEKFPKQAMIHLKRITIRLSGKKHTENKKYRKSALQAKTILICPYNNVWASH